MACTTILANVAAEQCAVKPGLTTVLLLAFVGDLTSIGAAVDHAVSTIAATAPKGFYSINCSKKESDQSSKPNENGGFTTEVKYFVSKQEASKSNIFNSLNGVESLVAITTDQNGEKTIIGALDHPVLSKVEASKNPRNGYTLTLTWEEHGNLPYHFTGTVPMAA